MKTLNDLKEVITSQDISPQITNNGENQFTFTFDFTDCFDMPTGYNIQSLNTAHFADYTIISFTVKF